MHACDLSRERERGTAKRWRGHASPTPQDLKDTLSGRTGILQQDGAEAQRLDPLLPEIGGPPPIVSNLILLIVTRPVDLDRQPRLSAVEIEDVRPDWMLSPELEAAELSVLQPQPEAQFLGCERSA
jgi:hypothetical protein